MKRQGRLHLGALPEHGLSGVGGERLLECGQRHRGGDVDHLACRVALGADRQPFR